MAEVVRIIIPVYGLATCTAACLESLRRTTPGRYFQVVVVDDGSTDETPQRIPALGRSLFGSAFRFVRLEHNQGFASACNAGAADCAAASLLFLNNDTLLTDGWLPPLLRAFQDFSRLGACSPLLFFPESGRLQHGGIVFDPDLRASHLYFLFPGSHPVLTVRRRLQALSGSTFLVPRTLFEDLGGFFPGYVNGSEDLDLCASLRARGFELACIPQSRIFHKTSQTPGRFDRVAANSQLLNVRQSGRFRPDLALLGRRDGFELRLTEGLQPFLSIPDERGAALEHRYPAEDAAACEQALEDEPLWEAGYARALARRETSGDGPAAAMVARVRAHFFPSLANLAEAARLAGRVGDAQGAAEALAGLETIRRRLARPDRLAVHARANQQLFREAGQADVAKAYGAWITRYEGKREREE